MTKASFSDSTNELNDAIRKLEAFSNPAIEEYSVSKTISLIRSLVLETFGRSLKTQEKDPQEHEVLRAVELINSKRLLIQKLKAGSESDQKLAESLTKAIETYNEYCEKRINESKQSLTGLAKFLTKEKTAKLSEMPKIDLPSQATVAYHFSENVCIENASLEDKPSAKTVVSSVSLPKQSAELFQMKALALLERYGIASNPEARTLVKQSPIFTMESNASTYTLKQTLTLFPGQTVVVMGTSALDPKTQTISKLFPETFFVSLESTQTGFPYPSQRSGWTLAHQLLPESPQRIDLLKETASIFQRKKQAMQDLLPHGNLINKAKRLLQLKKRAFAAHAEEFINLHKQLSQVILESAPSFCASPEAKKNIANFYETLKSHPSPFELLVETHQALRDCYISKPHQTLWDAILKGKSTNLGSSDPDIRYRAAKNILDQAIADAKQEVVQIKNAAQTVFEKVKWLYIESMGESIGLATLPIILQYLSEDLIFSPPTLQVFEKKIQTASYMHLKDFLDELDQPLDNEGQSNQELAYRLLKQALLADIVLFQSQEALPLSEELAQYFQKRYASLSRL